MGSERSSLILDYLAENQCSLKICNPRISKLGDFRVRGKQLSIKINNKLNPYRFILTLVHEIAHLKTYNEYGFKRKPHGKEWKHNYKQLLLMWQIEDLFSKSPDLLTVFNIELQNPKACSGVSIKAEEILRSYDDDNEAIILAQLSEGQQFKFRNTLYQKLNDRRTRVLCLNLENNRKYTIHKASAVQLIV